MNPPYRIRRADPVELELVIEYTQTMAEESEGRRLDDNTVRSGVEAIFEDPQKGTYWVIEESETHQIIGSALITTEWSDWNNSPYWWVQSVYLLPDYRGQGLMQRLLNTLEEEARQEDATEIRLYVEQENRRAIRAYEKAGFKKSHYKMMTKTLSG